MKVVSQPGLRIGADENGLGAQLGPMIVTAVLADVDGPGARLLGRRLPQALRRDLDDSKALVSCHDVSLGEAWTRALVERTTGVESRSPAELFRAISLVPESSLRQRCPRAAEPQCWSTDHERFEAKNDQLARTRSHLRLLERRGVQLRAVRTRVLCASLLNELKRQGIHRFTADLHAMEELVLALRELAGGDIAATCGKVGGIGRYDQFFGPLSGRLFVELMRERACSAYRFPGVGELRFVRDADATDPLVMLASLVGKYVRELLMRRVAAYYPEQSKTAVPSGYHDPVSRRFVEDTAPRRRQLAIIDDCFVRTGAE